MNRGGAVPTYQYACTACDHSFEQFQSFTDDALTVCPQCQGRLRKVFNAVGVVFKGSGFYRTDSRSDASSSAKGSSGGTDGSSAASAGDSAGKTSSTETSTTSTTSPTSPTKSASKTTSSSSAA
jgi:putative FmdB family regulatory protein